MKSCLSFGGGLEGSNDENVEATESRGSLVKCGETLFEGGCVPYMLCWVLGAIFTGCIVCLEQNVPCFIQVYCFC